MLQCDTAKVSLFMVHEHGVAADGIPITDYAEFAQACKQRSYGDVHDAKGRQVRRCRCTACVGLS